MASAILEAQANFALDLLRHGVGEHESAIMSPFSVAIALAMTYAGADGKTKKELNEALAKGLPDSEIHDHFAELVEELSKPGNGYTLNTANRLYVDQGFSLKETFMAVIKSKYAGQLQAEDFRQATAVANKINTWVEDQTNSKIKDLVKPDVITEDSRLILVNAVYFKGDWAKKFDEANTQKKPFYTSADEHREVDMMRMKDKFDYTEDEDWQILGLPYKNAEVNMYVFLPKEKFALAKRLKALDGQRIMEMICDCGKVEVEVELPKFKLEKKLELVETLKKLGIEEAFSQSNANFSGISDTALCISDVIHKAFIEVNEEGSEAAAASAAIMMLRAAPVMPSGPISFIADHPFLFAIVNEEGSEAAAATNVGIAVMCLPPPPEQFNADHPFIRNAGHLSDYCKRRRRICLQRMVANTAKEKVCSLETCKKSARYQLLQSILHMRKLVAFFYN
ncbi:putative serpin-like protein [Toxocara canis]|uniref:Putative serpin-like protein n=1 Tax=Toxocara canis TaxID=6265 RepID=A0A0B2VFZ3_TOXCA|nr:putative serpin-like protein [Toxocara canis]